MVQDLGNSMMTKNTILRLALLLVLPVMITACSDKDNETEAVNNNIEIEKTDVKTSSQEAIINTANDVGIQELMQQVAQAEHKADEYGFVWSTTDGIIEKAYAEAKKGNENEAKILFQEAKLQFELSIEQAKYAEQHWTLLIPEND